MSTLRLAAAVAFLVMGAAPTFAQNQPQPAANPPAAGDTSQPGMATVSPTGLSPSQRNPLLTDNSEVQINKLIGSTIYNKDDKDIGTIRDVLANQQGQLQVVVSTNDKRVLVPWDKLQFGDAKLNDHNKVLMLNETQQTLNNMPAFSPTAKRGGNG